MSVKQNKLERCFQKNLIDELKDTFEGCIVLKNDSSYVQGIPDLLVLHNDKWCALECKKFKGAKRRPNQEYYIDKLDKMAFARFIYPENKSEVLTELTEFFGGDHK